MDVHTALILLWSTLDPWIHGSRYLRTKGASARAAVGAAVLISAVAHNSPPPSGAARNVTTVEHPAAPLIHAPCTGWYRLVPEV